MQLARSSRIIGEHGRSIITPSRRFSISVTAWYSLRCGRLKGSSSFVEGHSAWVTEWVEGKIARDTAYTDVEEARAAAERLAQERADG